MKRGIFTKKNYKIQIHYNNGEAIEIKKDNRDDLEFEFDQFRSAYS